MGQEFGDDFDRLREAEHLQIAIAGWSACGKTYYSKLLASALRYPIFSASEKILESIGCPPGTDWIAQRAYIRSQRRMTDADEVVDESLLDAARKMPRMVIDAWTAPWLLQQNTHVSIWFDCPIEIRAENAAGPGNYENISREAIIAGLKTKDMDSAELFKQRYGIEYGPDPDVFDYVLDVAKYMGNEVEEWPRQRAALLSLLREVLMQSLLPIRGG
ncbi:cytidylate kinase-like family protein [Nocardia nova]